MNVENKNSDVLCIYNDDKCTYIFKNHIVRIIHDTSSSYTLLLDNLEIIRIDTGIPSYRDEQSIIDWLKGECKDPIFHVFAEKIEIFNRKD